MDKERIKNWILTSLVMLSLFFTVQLWLDVPIERIMVNPDLSPRQDSEKDYDLSNFVLPRWIIVNFGGQSHTKLFRESSTYRFYNDIYGEVSNILKYVLDNSQNITFGQVTAEEWEAAKLGKSVVVEYDNGFDVLLMKKIFRGDAEQISIPVQGIRSITLTFATESEIYIEGGQEGIIYKAVLPKTNSQLIRLIGRLEERDPVKYWMLGSDIGYGDNDYIYLPLDMSSFNLPLGMAVKEFDISEHDKMEMLASNFFTDMSIVRKITETSGSLIFTDGQNALKVDTNGSLEYLVYNMAGSSREQEQIDEIVDTALNFIDNHGGIPDQLYLKEILDITENGYEGYMLKFNYAYNGLPFFYNGRFGRSAIEVTVVNNRVVNYKRLVHRITRAKVVQKPLLNPVEVIDIIAGHEGGEKPPILDILDMYLGYCIDMAGDRNYQAVPVWYIKSRNGEYIIDAYQGSLMN